jgi:hypothetical protein
VLFGGGGTCLWYPGVAGLRLSGSAPFHGKGFRRNVSNLCWLNLVSASEIVAR